MQEPPLVSSPEPLRDRPERVLRDIFGYTDFRGQQKAIVDAALSGRDTLVLIPPRGGNSTLTNDTYSAPTGRRSER